MLAAEYEKVRGRAHKNNPQDSPDIIEINPLLQNEVKNAYKVHIAIDFGTDGVALAYAIDGEVYMHQNFHSRRGYGSSQKPKAIVLMDDEDHVTSFGIDAKFTLSLLFFNWTTKSYVSLH